jgi:hypothetical protein
MTNPKSILRIDFSTGTTPLEALTEMKEKAIMFNVAYIVSTINNIEIYVSQNAHIGDSYKKYQEGLELKRSFIVC